MIRENYTVEQLEALLNLMNENGTEPTVAILDGRGSVALVYGVEEGDESMGLRVFYSPGDDRVRSPEWGGDPGEHRIEAFELTIEEAHLWPPFRVLGPSFAVYASPGSVQHDTSTTQGEQA